jgi:hypothetical protein
MATVLVAIQRQHAGADDARGREPRVVDRERRSIAHDVDAQIAPSDDPAVEHRDPRNGLELT